MWKHTSNNDGVHVNVASNHRPSSKFSADCLDSDREIGVSSHHYQSTQSFTPQVPVKPAAYRYNPNSVTLTSQHQPSYHPAGGNAPVPASQRTAEWLGRYVVPVTGADTVVSPSSTLTSRDSNGSTSQCGHVSGMFSHHRLSGQSYESSGVSSARHSIHSSSGSSSIGSLDRLDESAYSSSLNVHQLYQAGLADDEVLRAWLADLHFEEYFILFIQAGYDMPTISRMTPEDLTAIGITKPAHRKRIKIELSRLHIHDGIPDFRPADVKEWLQLLNLEEYIPSLTAQGYCDIDSLADITWEDLEEIGVKKLGHQKKMMLALDRLTKMQSGWQATDQRGSSEVLEPPAAYPCVETEASLPSSPSHCLNHRHMTEDVLITCPQRSPSRDNLSLGFNSELTTFQQHRPSERDGGDVVHLRQKNIPNYESDTIALQLNHNQNVRMSNMSGDSAYESEGGGGGSVYSTTYHSPFQTQDHWAISAQKSMHDNRERSDELDYNAAPKRPSAKVSPQPKPKPVAKIPAKRTSREMPADFHLSHHKSFNESSLYTSKTLPRKSSSHGHMEHIYDQPADLRKKSPNMKHSTFGVITQSSAPSSPAHTSAGDGHFAMPSPGGRVKRPPPPPPKRTNSIKTQELLRKLGESKSAAVSNSEIGAASSSMGISSNASVSPIYSNTPVVASSPNMQNLPPQNDKPVTEEFSASELDNPLGEVIEQLEQGRALGSSTATQVHQPAIPPKPIKKQAKLGDWQDEPSSGDESDSSGGASRVTKPISKSLNPSCTSLDSNSSSTSSDSNNLPFANENVGTIKQRNAGNKPSIQGSVEGSCETFTDPDLLEETDTMKRKPKASTKGKMATCQPSQAGPVITSESSPPEPDVLGDIDSMLQDLTSELDAMLDSDLLQA